MDWYRHICDHMVTPLWAKWEKSNYLEHIRYLKELQFASTDEIEQIQWRKVKSLVSHAYENCKYYKSVFKKEGLYPNDIESWRGFERIPVLTKEDMRNHFDDLIASNRGEKRLISGITSGSTGKPLRFLVDEGGLQWTRALNILTQEWAGWRRGRKKFAVIGVHANEQKHGVRWHLRNSLLERITLLNTLELSEKSMFDFYKKLRKERFPFIYGYAHAVYLFAKFLREHGLLDIHACGIVTGGMVLHNHERSLIEKVFDSKAFNRYGTEEMGVIACECESHQGLHISETKYYVEFRNGDRKAVPGEMGSLVITDLANYGMPFIRYEIEDVAMLSCRKCSCGRTWSLVLEIGGRTSDFIVTPEKKLVSGISLTDFFASVPGIVQMQIVQNRIDHLTFKIVKSSEFCEESINKLKGIERRFFGDRVRVSYEFVDHIAKEPRGKYRFVKSEIAKRFLEINRGE